MEASGLPAFIRRRLDPEQRYGLRVTLFAMATVLVFLPFGLLLVQVLDQGPFTRYDQGIASALNTWARETGWVVPPLRVLSFMGKPIWFYGIVGSACVYLIWRSRLRLAAFLVVTGLVGGVVDTAVKVLVSRERPRFEDPLATAFGKSFPSGHTFTSTVMYGALLLVFMPAIPRRGRPWAAGGCVLLVALIGFSRLGLGVHFLTDVIGGFILGTAWLIASTAAFQIWRQERGRKPAEVMRGLEPEAARDLKPSDRG